MARTPGRAPAPRPSDVPAAATRTRDDVTDPGAAGLTPRRRAVLDALRSAADPQGVAEVADRLAVHPNTVRFHLDALVADGRVERTLEEPSGPGRPRTVYAARGGMDRGGARSYRLLARMLLSLLAAPAGAGEGGKTGAGADARETGDAETAAAVTGTGRDWGRDLVGDLPPSRPPTAGEAVDRLTAVLADLGFDPEPRRAGAEADRIRLRHCPFLELAEEYGQVVCPLHLGLMQGALAELRAPVAATRLEPFAEPGACLAHLAPAAPPPGRSPDRTTPSDGETPQR